MFADFGTEEDGETASNLISVLNRPTLQPEVTNNAQGRHQPNQTVQQPAASVDPIKVTITTQGISVMPAVEGPTFTSTGTSSASAPPTKSASETTEPSVRKPLLKNPRPENWVTRKPPPQIAPLPPAKRVEQRRGRGRGRPRGRGRGRGLNTSDTIHAQSVALGRPTAAVAAVDAVAPAVAMVQQGADDSLGTKLMHFCRAINLKESLF